MTDSDDLAACLMGLDVDDYDLDALEDALVERYGLDLGQFADLTDRLLEFTVPLQSPLSGEWSHVFGEHVDGGGAFAALCKKPAVVPKSRSARAPTTSAAGC